MLSTHYFKAVFIVFVAFGYIDKTQPVKKIKKKNLKNVSRDLDAFPSMPCFWLTGLTHKAYGILSALDTKRYTNDKLSLGGFLDLQTHRLSCSANAISLSCSKLGSS